RACHRAPSTAVGAPPPRPSARRGAPPLPLPLGRPQPGPHAWVRPHVVPRPTAPVPPAPRGRPRPPLHSWQELVAWVEDDPPALLLADAPGHPQRATGADADDPPTPQPDQHDHAGAVVQLG